MPRDETAFFGRADELAEIERRFAAGARLVTVVGLGGIGKTRIALAAATRSERDAVFVPLSEARTLEAAVREVASALGLRLAVKEHASAALEALASELDARGALLVLDNTEQLGAGARELVRGLLNGAPELRILATSREPIGARGEERLVLPALNDEEAVALLRDRARLARGGSGEVADVDALAIVQRVDRLPLAIELAASRLEVLSPVDLLARLGARLDVLVDASGAVSGMFRTMRATLDWSWDLLSDVERSALVQASVFAAPFGVDAAEEVIGGLGDEVLDVLESLVKRSLLSRIASSDGRVRLGMFETVREWAREKSARGDVERRHALYHLGEAERLAAQTYGDRAVAALDALADLLPELLSAFETTKKESPATAARIVVALSDLLLFRSLFELRSELAAAGAFAAERSQDDQLVARTLVLDARVTLEEGRMADAETKLRRALELASRSDDDITRAEAIRSLGWALVALGRIDEAEAALTEAQALHRQHGSVRGLADAHVALGILRALQGRPADGLAQLREALAIHVEHGDVVRQEKVLGFAGLVGHDAREVARGLPRTVLAHAPSSSLDVLPLPVAELASAEGEAGARWQSAIELHRRGAAAYDRGDLDAAVSFFDRAIHALERAGVKHGVAALHAHVATAFANMGDLAEALARLELARAASQGDPAAELAVTVFGMAVDVAAGRADEPAARALLERATRAEISTPDLAVATRVLEAGLTGARRSRPNAADVVDTQAAVALVVGPASRWILPPRGERLDLSRYGAVRRLLDRLVVARLEEPGVALTAEALIEAGWPGERMRHSAGLLRVYSGVRRLRRLGLEAFLVTRDDGYLLDPNASVRRADD
ncbi:MAG TPA: tetratricopeptide repeat protein [Labilithrix sp.]|nr:tetratricopeptide repeat protein [Labilithrix sp.]